MTYIECDMCKKVRYHSYMYCMKNFRRCCFDCIFDYKWEDRLHEHERARYLEACHKRIANYISSKIEKKLGI